MDCAECSRLAFASSFAKDKICFVSLHFKNVYLKLIFSSVQFSCSVVSDSLQPLELQHTRPPCPSPTPRVHQNSCASSWWCHPAISSSVIPFSSCPQPLPASKSFPMSQLFAWGGQRIGVSASASVLPMNTQDWFPLGRTDWISILQSSAFFTVQLSYSYMTTGKSIALTRPTFVGKVMSLLLNMLSRLVITFLPRSKRLLISWLQSPSAVISCNNGDRYVWSYWLLHHTSHPFPQVM